MARRRSTRRPVRAIRRPPRSLTERATSGPDRRGELVVTGDARRGRGVLESLGGLRVKTRWWRWGPDLEEAVEEEPVGVVLVAPLPGTELVPAVRELSAAAATPTAVVLSERVAAARVRALYAAGAGVVFAWPRDALILSQVLAEALAIGMVRGKPRRGDVALARTVRAHLVTARVAVRGLDVVAADGVIEVAGSVDGLWRKRDVEATVARVAGVRHVDLERLRVVHSGIPDQRILSRLRALMRDATDIDPATVSVVVRRGYVTLAGSTSDRRELRRLIDLLAHVRGVRGIDNLVVVSSVQRQRDATLVRRLRAYLADIFPRLAIRVTAFGHVVVLDGTVETLAARRSVAAFVAGDPGVGRVVNKLRVAH